LYGIASNEAYGDPNLEYFRVEKYDRAFLKLASGDKGGIHFDAYIREAGIPSVVVAFRGTRLWEWRDWVANFSWFTGVLPIDSEYAAAREVFMDIRQQATTRFGSKPNSYVTTGHSLGGGLALHVAAGFPCVDAVVFDSSFVTNAFLFSDPFPGGTTIHIYDKDDELTKFRNLAFTETDTQTYRWYPIKLVPCKDRLCHAATPFVIGMARAAVECQLSRSADCLIPQSDTRAQDIYCPALDGRRDPLCKDALKRLGLNAP
jgi:pimeloyl-ACP methyl ester carboxylesterase